MLRPKQLPRPLSCLIVAVVYCPPNYLSESKKKLSRYIINCCDKLLRDHPNAGLFITGDFNTMQTDCFHKELKLVQTVKRATRKSNILDKIFTNCRQLYASPIIIAPLGKSDHNCVLVRPNSHTEFCKAESTSVSKYCLTPDILNSLKAAIKNIRWQQMYSMDDCAEQANFFYDNVASTIGDIVPVYSVKASSSDRPWITPYFKKLVAKRGKAFANGDLPLYRNFRNRTNRVRKSLQRQYFLDKVDKLKNDDPSRWWKNMKTICRFNRHSSNDCFVHILYQSNTVNSSDLPDTINKYLGEVTQNIPVLDHTLLDSLRYSLEQIPSEYIVDVADVYALLSKVKVHKSMGPDGIPHKILRDLSDVLAPPLTAIINSSLRQGIVPLQWKQSRIVPVPKVFPPCSVENDIRPIAVTNVLAKISETVVGRFFNDVFDDVCDFNQYGSVRGRSTTFALLKVMHDLFNASDVSSNIIRVLFVDFSKAFDLIDHNILFRKFIGNGIPDHISVWSLDFLTGRTQYVKIGNIESDSTQVNAGAPQGTVSGPNDFKLMINDLTFDTGYIKYVDDTTVYSVSNDPSNSTLQTAADNLVSWSQSNGMRINALKTKEMLIYFGKKVDTNVIKPVSINGVCIERVKTFKLLGVFVSCDLTWDVHVSYILGKTAKRLYCIRYLVHAGVRESDIVCIYCSIVRSVLEYACAVWHPGLTVKLSKDIERVQKRCLKLIFPSLSYTSALEKSGLERLDDRRENITEQMFRQIKCPTHPLHSLLPLLKVPQINLRSSYPYTVPIFKKISLWS